MAALLKILEAGAYVKARTSETTSRRNTSIHPKTEDQLNASMKGNFLNDALQQEPASPASHCTSMAIEAGKCVLIIDGQRFDGFSFGLEWNGGPQAFGFLSGPVEILRKARAARMVDLELDGGTKLPAAVLEVSRSEMALVTIDPKMLQYRESRTTKP
jgi:hypothetical protein